MEAEDKLEEPQFLEDQCSPEPQGLPSRDSLSRKTELLSPATGKPDNATLEVPVPHTNLCQTLQLHWSGGSQGSFLPPQLKASNFLELLLPLGISKALEFPICVNRPFSLLWKSYPEHRNSPFHQGCHDSNTSKQPWAHLQTTTHGQTQVS